MLGPRGPGRGAVRSGGATRHAIPVEFVDAEGLASRDAGVTTRHALAVAFPRELADTAAEPPLDVGLFLDRVRSYVDVEPTLERSQPAALEEVAELGRRSRHSRATSRSPVGSRPAESTS